MSERIDYLSKKLDELTPFYIKHLGGRLSGLNMDLELFMNEDEELAKSCLSHANEMFSFCNEKYSKISIEDLKKHPDLGCLVDVPEMMNSLNQKLMLMNNGDKDPELVNSARQLCVDIIENGQKFRKSLEKYMDELEALGEKDLAWKYRHQSTHNY